MTLKRINGTKVKIKKIKKIKYDFKNSFVDNQEKLDSNY